MSALQDIGLFLRLSQIIGLIPFSYESDPQTGHFVRFKHFSWRHFVTWYYVGIFAFQTIGYLSIVFQQSDRFTSDGFIGGSFQQLPFAAMVLLGMTIICYAFLILIMRMISLRYNHFRNAIGFIQEFELLLPKLPGYNKNTVRRRTVIAWIINIFTVLDGIFIVQL